MAIKSKCIMVIGFPCGGTSALAGMYHSIGVSMGKPAQIEDQETFNGWPCYPENPKGQYEDDRWVHVDKFMQGGCWYYPIMERYLLPQDKDKMQKCIDDRIAEGIEPWGVKLPSFCFTGWRWLMQMHKQVDVRIVVILREPETVARRLVERFGVQKEIGFMEPLGARNFAGEAIRSLYKTLTVGSSLGLSVYQIGYDTLTNHYQSKAIIDDTLNKTLDGWLEVTPEMREKAYEFIDPSYNHERGEKGIW